jgi:hypothetical protein
MEPPSEETMSLAFEIFDRYGTLKREIYEHPVRKGSGVWKEEMNDGNIALINTVKVNAELRRKGIGTKLVLLFLQNAMASVPDVKFAFTVPGILNDSEDRDDRQKNKKKKKLTKKKELEIRRSKFSGMTHFFRTLHFRRVGVTDWLALARDEGHPSRQLLCHEDPDLINSQSYDSESDSEDEPVVCGHPFNVDVIWSKNGQLPQNFTSRNGQANNSYDEARIVAQKHPLHCAIKRLADEDALAFLQSHTQHRMRDRFDLEATNGHGDTTLHIAAKYAKTACLIWIVDSPSGLRLLNMTNNARYTPLEAMQSKLDTKRIGKPFGFQRTEYLADRFDGFDENSVACLLKLNKVEQPTAEQQERAKFGCTCEKCVDGFISPRMFTKLHIEAEQIYAILEFFSSPGTSEGEEWYQRFKGLLNDLPETLKPLFRKSKISRKVFTMIFQTIAVLLAHSMIPREVNVANILKKASTWAQIDIHYFQKGGTVAHIMNAIIDYTKYHDPNAGTPTKFQKVSDDRISSLPRCRNDDEFEFVRRQYNDDGSPKLENDDRYP